MKKKILVISGGISKERKISLETGNQVSKELKKNGYKVKICEPNFNLTNIVKDLNQIVFLMPYMVNLVRMDIFNPF